MARKLYNTKGALDNLNKVDEVVNSPFKVVK